MELRMNTGIEPLPHRNYVALAILATAPVILAAALGTFATMPNISGWYSTLVKPSFSPPNWLFAPVWTALYVSMAYAFFRILHLDISLPGRTAAIIVFVAQLTLNATWSFAFFAAQSPFVGLLVIIPLESLIIASIILFAQIDRVAAICLWPYAAWVGFATLLNAWIWLLNP